VSVVPELDALEAALSACRIVDLTLTVAEDLPCSWPTHMPFQHKTFSWFANRGDAADHVINRTQAPYQTRWLLMDEHTGTHFDAPSHFIPPPDSGLPHAGANAACTTDLVPLEQLLGPAAVVDVSELAGTGEPATSPRIDVEHLLAWEEAHETFRPGEVVLLASGWDRRYLPGPQGSRYAADALVTRTSPGWPAPTAAAVELLLDRGIRCIGTDGVSIGATDDGEPAHTAGLAAGLVFVEALARLDSLPPRGAYFLFLPIKVRGGTGGPGRAIALLPR
jgi:kynurenine formamidase